MNARRLKGFDELADALRRAERQRLREAAEARAREAAARAALQRQQRAEQAFARAVGPVTRLADHGRAQAPRDKPPPQPRQRIADERAALRATWSDEVDLESLLLTDDGLSFRRPGIAPDVVARLRKGQWAIQRQIDLHGLRRDEAREALRDFLRGATRQGVRCLRVVHGKGLGSPGREPVLKGKVQRWLAQCDDVIAFAQATPPQGGAGALIVLMAP